MSQFHDTQLQQSETVAASIDQEPVSADQSNKNGSETMSRGTGNEISARTAVLAVFATGILAIPLAILLSSRAHLLPKLPVFVGLQSRGVSAGSAVLAVDTHGLTIRAKNASASTQEMLEQVAVRHLARLHRTYSRWADENRDLMGSLLLKLTVDATGTVVSVDPLASHVTSVSFTKTVMDDVRKWKFSKAGLKAAEIMVPLLFVPKGMDPNTVVEWERKVRNAQEVETAAAGARVTHKAPISTEGEHGQKSPTRATDPDRMNTTKSSNMPVSRPKIIEEAVLIAVKTNRPVAIRENPRFSSKKLHEVEEDTQLSIVENRGDWLKVKIADAGLVGFVRKEFVSPIN